MTQIAPMKAEPEDMVQSAHASTDAPIDVPVRVEDRVAPRFTLLIRPAKLLVGPCQIVCVIRDLSATGVSVRLFEDVTWRGLIQIELQTGDRYTLEHVWHRGTEAGFRFLDPVAVEDVIAQNSFYPKRDLRFDIDLPARLRNLTGSVDAQLRNISRQGGLLSCDPPLALNQPLRIESDRLPDIEARVRWRREGLYGLVFDTTFSLAALAEAVRSTQPDCSADATPQSDVKTVDDTGDAALTNS